MRYLVSINCIPHNIILADSQDVADHCASVVGGTARLLADDETVEFPPPPAPPREMQLTKLQFLRLFTTAERIAIRASSDPVIVDFLQLLDLAQDVRLDDPDTVQGVHYLESEGLIAAGRAAEILG